MKRLFFAIISVFLVSLIVFFAASCEESEEYSLGKPDVSAIIVTTSPTEDKPVSSAKKPKKKSDPQPKAIDSKLQTQLEDKLDSSCFSGVAIVSRNGKVVCEAANGTLSANSKKKINIDTPFAIASCSKQFTAACIMLLKEDGKLSVNDTIDKYFPKYKYGKDITVKNLLTMRSGIADFLNDNGSFAKYDVSKNASEKKNRKITLNWIMSRDLNYTPDSLYDYSNSNYFLLAEIVERVSGMSFADFLQERIFNPLGMYNTGVNEELAYSKNLALSERDPWDLPGAKGKNIPITIRVKGLNFGNGGLISTAEDMDKWLTSFRNYKVLSKKSVKEMTKDYNPDSSHYGYGVHVAKNGGVWHVGSLDYYAAYSFTIPDKGYNFFAVSNDKLAMNCDIYSFASSIIKFSK